MALRNPSRAANAFQVKRAIPLPGAEAATLHQLAQTLRAVDPIIEVHVETGRLRLRYDASGIGFQDIERLLDQAGASRPRSFRWRCRAAWYRFLDANARSNALSRGGACCNRPPPGAQGHRNSGP